MTKIGCVHWTDPSCSWRLIAELEEEADLEPTELPEPDLEDILLGLCDDPDPDLPPAA